MSKVKRSLDEKVKIQMVNKLSFVPKMNTVVGIIEIEPKNGTAEITLRGAHQMVDGTNWKYFNEKDSLTKREYDKLIEEEKLENGDVTSDDSEEQVNANDSELNDISNVGDDETRETIKKLPTMKLSELLSVAEDSIPDFDPTNFQRKNSKTKMKLIKLILKTLKGK